MLESIQKKIGRVRPPRVHITYDLETEGAIIQKELPCIMGLIVSLSKNDTLTYEERKFIFLDRDNINDVLKKLAPQIEISFTLPEGKKPFTLVFKEMKDFHPLSIIQQIAELRELMRRKSLFFDLKVKLLNSGKLLSLAKKLQESPETPLDQLFVDYKFPTENQRVSLMELFQLIHELKMETSPNLVLQIQSQVSELEGILCNALDEILHDREFQRLEGSWRGVSYLTQNLETGPSLKLRVLNASIGELYEDLHNAIEFDQSVLFKKLYEEEYGTYGGNPYTCLGIDHYIAQNARDFEFLRKMAEVVSAAHIPTSVGVDPSLFDLASFEDLHVPRDISKIFESLELIKFKSFRESDDAKYIGLILPRYMGRVPYGPTRDMVEGLNYDEKISSHEDFLWSNSIYPYLYRIGMAYARFNWFGGIIGPENGGMIDNLPVFLYKSKDGDTLIKCPTECAITDRREKELTMQGFMALCYCKDTDYAAFFSGQSAYKPPKFDKAIANSNAVLSARFQYMLNVCRFAHYIKCIMRDKIGTFSTKEDVEIFLSDWLSQYVLLSETSSQELKSSYPLAESSVIVEDDEQKPGAYRAIIYLKPHFQMEELTISLRLVARIPGGQ